MVKPLSAEPFEVSFGSHSWMGGRMEQGLRDMLAGISARQAAGPSPTLEEIRAGYREGYRARGPALIADIAVERTALPGTTASISIYTPPGPVADTLVVYFHGGGYVLGDAETYDHQSRWIARETGHRVAFVDYRLGPEHRFPAAPDDAAIAWDWLTGAHGMKPDNVVVSGDSAGGGLAVVTCLHAARKGAPPRAAVLLYPATDLRLPDRAEWQGSMKAYAKGYYLEAEEMYWFCEQYLATASDSLDWRASMILAPDLSLMPPTWIFGAEMDPIYDQGVAFAQALAEQGVEVEHTGFTDVLHNFIEHVAISRAATQAAQHYVDRLRTILDRS
jgi:acetyl esterase